MPSAAVLTGSVRGACCAAAVVVPVNASSSAVRKGMPDTEVTGQDVATALPDTAEALDMFPLVFPVDAWARPCAEGSLRGKRISGHRVNRPYCVQPGL
ncbi:hypothetical protein TUSST3_30090 [Streptomyces sp. TUS-ST3]|nr:hypothetical protein TUSST3_30090 [Streptomyces sp. TUS-ST3]